MSAHPRFYGFASCKELGIKPQAGDKVLVWPDPPPASGRRSFEVVVVRREDNDLGIVFELGGVYWALADAYCAPAQEKSPETSPKQASGA